VFLQVFCRTTITFEGHDMKILLLVLLGIAGIAPRTAFGGSNCHEVSGLVVFNGLHVAPDTPAVGDSVTLQFDLDLAVYSVTSLHVDGTSPLLDGETTLFSTHDATFNLTAVQAGTTMVQLSVKYGTEEQCTDNYGHTYFQEGPDRTVMSPPYVVDIAEGAVSCPGDCDGDNQVTVDELVRGVALALGDDSVAACGAFDRDRDHAIAIDELEAAVLASLSGCPPSP
jgi:hypothetical protein